jgi:hypothetical protein
MKVSMGWGDLAKTEYRGMHKQPVNLMVKQQLIEGLLELPYCGRDFRYMQPD